MIYKKICTGVSFNRGALVLQIFARDQNLVKKCIEVEQMPMYFYMKEFDDIEENDMREVIQVFNGHESLYNKPLQKVTVKHLKSIGAMGRKYHGYESDVKWDKHCMWDLKVNDKFYIYRNKIKTMDNRFQDEHNIPGVAHDTMIDSHEDIQQENMVDVDIPLRICCFDIEVITEKKEDLNTFNGEIVCAVFWDSYTNRYDQIYSEGNEKNLIITMLEYLKDMNPDIITGWNVNFDVNWMMKRAEALEIDINDYVKEGKSFIKEYTTKMGKFVREPVIAGKVILDGKDLYIKKTKTTEKLASYSLKPVAIVEGFPEWEDLGNNMKYEWNNNKFKVLEYCRLDVERTWGIISKNKLIFGADVISRISGCNLDEALWNSKIIDSMLFLYKGDKVLPNINYARDNKEVKGAEVLDAIVGLHNNVGIFDGASLYPSIISGLNISSETLVTDLNDIEKYPDRLICIPVGDRKFYFWKKKYRNGLLPIVVTELRKLREEVRINRALATKTGNTEAFKTLNDEEKVLKGLLASVYGVMGFTSFRLYNEDCANAITGVARNLIYEMQKYIEGPNCRIIYGDTDSVFIKMTSVDDGFIVKEKINEVFFNYTKSLGADDNIITVNYEKFFKWVLFIKKGGNTEDAAKKKYIGYIGAVQSGENEMKEVSELYYKGFELRRSDTAKALKHIMKEFFRLMESGDWQASIDYLKKEKKEFTKWGIRDLAIPRSINKEDANNPHARGMKYAKEVLGFEFNPDELPKLIHVDYQGSYPVTKEICFNDNHVIPDAFKPDYSKMFDKLFKIKFEPILEALNLNWEISLENQQTMEQWFA